VFKGRGVKMITRPTKWKLLRGSPIEVSVGLRKIFFSRDKTPGCGSLKKSLYKRSL